MVGIFQTTSHSTMLFFLFLLLLLLNTIQIISQPIFSYASLTILNQTQPFIPFDFLITFNISLISPNITHNEPTAILLPRFTRNLNIQQNYSANNISYSHLLLSPSSFFEGEFLEGSHDGSESYSTLPYKTAMLILRTKHNLTLIENSTYAVKVYKENGIGAICGFTNSSYYTASANLVYDPAPFSIQSIRYGIEAFNTTSFSYNYTFNSSGDLTHYSVNRHNHTLTYHNYTIFENNTRIFDDYTGLGNGCSSSNQCNGHGTCDFCYQTCYCYDGYGSASDLIQTGSVMNKDCSSRICPAGTAIADIPTGTYQAHARAECSNRGNCNRNTGLCECFPPFIGSACERLACPNDCSGHGVCVSMEEYTERLTEIDPKYRVDNKTIVYGSANGMNTVAWDYDTMYQCICDSSWPVGYGAGQRQLPEWFGPACSKRHCPTGDDPFTSIDETNCNGISQLGGGNYALCVCILEPCLTHAFIVTVEKGLLGNICQVDCANRGVCDYSTGICECFEGSWGDGCENLSGTGVHPLISDTIESTFWLTDGNSSIIVVGN